MFSNLVHLLFASALWDINLTSLPSLFSRGEQLQLKGKKLSKINSLQQLLGILPWVCMERFMSMPHSQLNKTKEYICHKAVSLYLFPHAALLIESTLCIQAKETVPSAVIWKGFLSTEGLKYNIPLIPTSMFLIVTISRSFNKTRSQLQSWLWGRLCSLSMLTHSYKRSAGAKTDKVQTQSGETLTQK